MRFFFVGVLDITRVPLSIFNFEISINYVTGDHITKKRKNVNTQKLFVRFLPKLVGIKFDVLSYLCVNLVGNFRRSPNIEVLTTYVTLLLGVTNVGMCFPVKLLFGWTDFDAVSFVKVLDIMQVTLSIFIFFILTNYVTGDHITKKSKNCKYSKTISSIATKLGI